MKKVISILLAPFRWLKSQLRSFRAWSIFLLIVIAILIAYYVVADRYTPITTDAYAQAFVVQVAGRVEGKIVRVHVKDNDRVRRGDVLFEIDPRPFEHKVAQLTAKVELAVKQVAQMQSELDAARAEHTRLQAEERYAHTVYVQEEQIFRKDATTERKYQDALQKHRAAVAAVERALKQVDRAEQALAARIGDEHALVADAKAQLAEAKLNLEYSRVHAPADGYITTLQLREGAYGHVGQPVLTLIETGQWLVVANYRENCLSRIEQGQPAWVSFNNYPGRIFKAKVYSVGWGVSQGQGVPSGQLPFVSDSPGWIRAAQRFQVRLELEDAEDVPLRVGMTATTSIYTDPYCPVNPVTELLHRLMAIFDFVY